MLLLSYFYFLTPKKDEGLYHICKMPRKLVDILQKKKKFTISMSIECVSYLKTYAKHYGLNRSAAIERLCMQVLNNKAEIAMMELERAEQHVVLAKEKLNQIKRRH